MAERKFRITAGQGPESLHLTIEDELSGTTLARIHLDATQIWQVLRGGIIFVDGQSTDHPGRIGKKLVVVHEEVPASVLTGVAYADRERAGDEWARATFPGWTEYAASKIRGGVKVIMRKWVKP